MPSPLQADNYQRWSATTAVFKSKDSFSYLTLGLAGEAGEVCNKAKKVIRDHDGVMTAEDKQQLADELGDVLWYAARFAAHLGLSLSDVMQANMDKLNKRKAQGKLGGSGDNR